ncbi:hypothetical protein PDESU_02026 [Pontiella desulfatans]|uniref:Type IV secretion system coupling protein TraD DNA-binding domain-containing protein n=2 Tax=Pontiella desulfatans TaxID=2750659 RepID=A0A6C2U0X1_PONDE|nr:hypothetical protein PDESU_02026 [Pontiella desulfatans]
MAAKKLMSLLSMEIAKGCSPKIEVEPVRLEPCYALFGVEDNTEQSTAIPEVPIVSGEWIRLRIWVSPEQKCDWNRSEILLKSMASLTHRVAFEISGNMQSITIGLLVHKADAYVLSTIFRGLFECSEVTVDREPLLECVDRGRDTRIYLADYYPDPPYSHLLTSYEELNSPTFMSLIQALSQIPASDIGFYQCVFQPVTATNDWHRNVKRLLDLEYEINLHGLYSLGRRIMQQAPSGDLRSMASDVEMKAHNDRPFFNVAARIGVITGKPHPPPTLLAVMAFMNLYQHGGRPLRHVGDREYRKAFTDLDMLRMIQRGTVYRPGFLVNSRELVGLAHLFHAKLVEQRRLPLAALETLPVRDQSLHSGTYIGDSRYAGEKQRVCIPEDIRSRSTHILSAAGMGKSTVLLNMLRQDIEEGGGAVFIDIHGDAVKQALTIIPDELRHRTIYFNPGDPDWVPLWNPLTLDAGENIYRRADDIVGALRRVFSDWGDRLEHVIRNGLIGLSYLKHASLLDLYCLVRQGSSESEELRRMIVEAAQDEPVKKFWQHDFLKDYRKTDLQAPKHKLSKLVSAGNVSLMLSQSENRISFRRIMDEGMILLVDLSSVGNDAGEILGAFMLSLFLNAAMSRSDTPIEQRKRFSIFADEAHRFVAANALENIIVQARKFGINLCLAHQYLSQFGTRQVDALSTAGTTILGKADKRDSQFFAKDMQDLVDPKDIMKLEKYEMIVRIGKEVVRMETRPPPEAESGDWRAILENTHQNYCMPVDAVRKGLARRSERWNSPFRDLSADEMGWSFTEEDLAYEEF